MNREDDLHCWLLPGCEDVGRRLCISSFMFCTMTLPLKKPPLEGLWLREGNLAAAAAAAANDDDDETNREAAPTAAAKAKAEN